MNPLGLIDNSGGNVASEYHGQNGAVSAGPEQPRPAAVSDIFAEIGSLLDHELPECRMNLVDNHTNLERVAEYCEVNYLQAQNKRAALEETKDYTTQSLASVAYQINTLAYNFSQLLDLQSNQLQNMEANLAYIGQVIRIHKEKVARREIGVLTASKTVGRQHKIVSLPNQEKLVKYVRKPIDFTALDKIGHGCKNDRADSGPLSATGTMKSAHHKQRGTSQSSIQALSSGPAPTTKPPTPPQTAAGLSSASSTTSSGMKIVGSGTLGKSSREYRTPPAVAPPQVPSHYAPNYPKKPGYSTLPLATMVPAGSSVGSHPFAPQQYGQLNVQNEIYKSSRAAQPSSNVSSLTLLNEHLPPPSQQLQTQANHSPPLPSPPPPPPSLQLSALGSLAGHTAADSALEHDHRQFMGRSSASGLAAIVPQDADLPGWVPKNFIEKVIAIYDYYADKEDELSFQESAVIYVLKKNDDGWWEGVMDGITGLFPGNYVEPCV